mmetsp:Transcript_3247/g.10761  ORF Transcript_3247/g.10761 Transcript_3247/m.10761 type:complete len:427 (+) Transcript_3247:110-1390(+)
MGLGLRRSKVRGRVHGVLLFVRHQPAATALGAVQDVAPGHRQQDDGVHLPREGHPAQRVERARSERRRPDLVPDGEGVCQGPRGPLEDPIRAHLASDVPGAHAVQRHVLKGRWLGAAQDGDQVVGRPGEAQEGARVERAVGAEHMSVGGEGVAANLGDGGAAVDDHRLRPRLELRPRPEEEPRGARRRPAHSNEMLAVHKARGGLHASLLLLGEGAHHAGVRTSATNGEEFARAQERLARLYAVAAAVVIPEVRPPEERLRESLGAEGGGRLGRQEPVQVDEVAAATLDEYYLVVRCHVVPEMEHRVHAGFAAAHDDTRARSRAAARERRGQRRGGDLGGREAPIPNHVGDRRHVAFIAESGGVDHRARLDLIVCARGEVPDGGDDRRPVGPSGAHRSQLHLPLKGEGRGHALLDERCAVRHDLVP